MVDPHRAQSLLHKAHQEVFPVQGVQLEVLQVQGVQLEVLQLRLRLPDLLAPLEGPLCQVPSLLAHLVSKWVVQEVPQCQDMHLYQDLLYKLCKLIIAACKLCKL